MNVRQLKSLKELVWLLSDLGVISEDQSDSVCNEAYIRYAEHE